MANTIKFDDYFDDEDHILAIFYLKPDLTVHDRAVKCYVGKTIKITPKNQFFAIWA